MWNGTADNGYPIINGIPDMGWHICDGTNGTPDLRDRFIVSNGNSYAVGQTGGETTHVLTVNEMPSHTHMQDAHNHGTNAQKWYGSTYAASWAYSGPGHDVRIGFNDASNLNATATNRNTGDGAAHENRPPYYALAFIMKL